MRAYVCSDHHGPLIDDAACDATPGWADAWAEVPARAWSIHQRLSAAQQAGVEAVKVALGDMTEGLQFRPSWWVLTDVEGNHDRGRGPAEIVIETERGRTIMLHGHRFDPWWARVINRPAALVGRLLESISRDLDERVVAWARKRLGLGRYGDPDVYASRAAQYAAARGAWQIVFGHLHVRFDEDVTVAHNGLPVTVRVVCTGCCCGGRLDIVEVEV